MVLLGCLALCVLQRLVNAEEKSSPRDCYRSCARIVLFWRHKHLFFVLISLALIVWQHPPDLRKLWKLNPGLCLTKIILGLCSISFNIFLYWTISLLHCSQRLRLNLNFKFLIWRALSCPQTPFQALIPWRKTLFSLIKCYFWWI